MDHFSVSAKCNFVWPFNYCGGQFQESRQNITDSENFVELIAAAAAAAAEGSRDLRRQTEITEAAFRSIDRQKTKRMKRFWPAQCPGLRSEDLHQSWSRPGPKKPATGVRFFLFSPCVSATPVGTKNTQRKPPDSQHFAVQFHHSSRLEMKKEHLCLQC